VLSHYARCFQECFSQLGEQYEMRFLTCQNLPLAIHAASSQTIFATLELEPIQDMTEVHMIDLPKP
jgi:hypothetical protein